MAPEANKCEGVRTNTTHSSRSRCQSSQKYLGTLCCLHIAARLLLLLLCDDGAVLRWHCCSALPGVTSARETLPAPLPPGLVLKVRGWGKEAVAAGG